MAHASTDPDNDDVIDCEYCDVSDFMGYADPGWRMLNGPHQDQMDWLPSDQILEVAGWGTTTLVISPLHEDPAVAPYPQVLRIPKSNAGTHYYLSYRQARHPYERYLPVLYRDRVSVHTYRGFGYRNTLLVAVLWSSAPFEDTANSVVVRPLSHDSVSATGEMTTWIDSVPPESVEDLQVMVRRKDEVSLTWSAVRDGESGLAGYRVYRDGVLLGSTDNTTYEDPTAVFRQTYSYLVAAYDEAGNESLGNTVHVTIRGYGRSKEGKKNKHRND